MNKELIRKIEVLCTLVEERWGKEYGGSSVGIAGRLATEILNELDKPLPEPTRSQQKDVVRYLIEDKNTQEWYTNPLLRSENPLAPLPHSHENDWTKDANEALQFNTQKEAQEYHDKYIRYDWCHITEHEFVAQQKDVEEQKPLTFFVLRELVKEIKTWVTPNAEDHTESDLAYWNVIKHIERVLEKHSQKNNDVAGDENFVTGKKEDNAYLAMFNCLSALVALKDLKDEHGKTKEYLERQPKTWELAKTILKKLNSNSGDERSVATKAESGNQKPENKTQTSIQEQDCDGGEKATGNALKAESNKRAGSRHLQEELQDEL